MSVASDKKRLVATAKKFAEGLRARKIGALSIKRTFETGYEVNLNGGWCVDIASWSGRPTISLSLDKYLGRKSRHFWFGFWSFKQAGIKDLVEDDLLTELRPAQGFEDKDGLKRGGIWVLKHTPSTAVLARPIVEYYEDEENDFGMYDIGDELNVDRAVNFIAGVVDSIESDSDNLSLEVRQIINDDQRDETTKERLINARLGQGQFREDLFRHWGRACAVTGCTVEHVLRASHIKPWKESDDKQRLDRFNGLLLSANLDALFDKHLISFDDQGKMLISEQLSDEEVLLLGLSGQLRMPLNAKQKGYLKIHRTKHQETIQSA